MSATAEAPSTHSQLTFFDLPVKENQSALDKWRASRKTNIAARNERLRQRFNYLYNTERKRIDDVIDTLCQEFCLEKITIERLLKS